MFSLTLGPGSALEPGDTFHSLADRYGKITISVPLAIETRCTIVSTSLKTGSFADLLEHGCKTETLSDDVAPGPATYPDPAGLLRVKHQCHIRTTDDEGPAYSCLEGTYPGVGHDMIVNTFVSGTIQALERGDGA